jgi:peptide deformylase
MIEGISNETDRGSCRQSQSSPESPSDILKTIFIKTHSNQYPSDGGSHAVGPRVGLAANHMGSKLRVLVMENKQNARYPRRKRFSFQAYLNAKIVRVSKKTEGAWEGCMSIPGYRRWVRRAREVTMTAVDHGGKRVRNALPAGLDAFGRVQ